MNLPLWLRWVLCFGIPLASIALGAALGTTQYSLVTAFGVVFQVVGVLLLVAILAELLREATTKPCSLESDPISTLPTPRPKDVQKQLDAAIVREVQKRQERGK